MFAFILAIGGNLMMFFHLSEIVALLLIPPAISMAAFEPKRFLRSCACLILTKNNSPQALGSLKRYSSANYATGVLLFLISFAVAFTYKENEEIFWYRIAFSTAPLIYSIVISELFIRTAITKIIDVFEQ